MSVSFYDLTVVNYLQTLNAITGVLEKGASHLSEAGESLEDMVQFRLIDDMNPFQFQVISVAHHSMGAMKGVAAGEFAPPKGYGEPDYEGLKQLVADSKGYLEGLDQAEVNALSEGSVVFKLGGNEIPFTAPNFIMSFSIPNFLFHATTTYDMLRMKGAPLGKLDYIGQIRMGV